MPSTLHIHNSKSNNELSYPDHTTDTNSMATSHAPKLPVKFFSTKDLGIVEEIDFEFDHTTDSTHSLCINNTNKSIDEQDLSNFNYSYEAIVNHKHVYSVFKQYLLSKKMEEAVEFLESVKHYRSVCKRYCVLSTPQSSYNSPSVAGKNCSTSVTSNLSISSLENSHEDELSHDGISLTFLDIEDSDDTDHSDTGITITNKQSDIHPAYSPSSFFSSESFDKVEKLANNIIETFICNISPKELNLPHALKEKTINSFKRIFQEHQQESPENLFRKVEMFIHETLKLNYFHCFLKSDLFHNYLIKTGKTIDILHEIGTPKEGIEYMAVESMADLKNQNFSLNDFAFLKRKVFCGNATNNREWILAVNKKQYRCYFTKYKFDFGNSIGLKFFKFEILFPYNVRDVLKTFTNQDYRQKIDEYIYDIQTIKYVEEPNSQTKDKLFTSVINHEKYKLIWPIKDREIIVCTSSVYDRVSNLYIIGFKSCDSICIESDKQSSSNNEKPSKKNKIIRACVVGGWFFESISENQTMFHEIYYIDMKGSIPKLMMDKVITNRASKFYKLGLKCLKENEKNGFPIPQRDAHLYKLFQQNGDIYLR